MAARRFWCVVAGIVLLAAAVAKFQAGTRLAYLPGPLGVVDASWPAIEALVGVVALAGAGRRLPHLAVTAVFTLIFLVALYVVLAGYPSCGCFGAVEIPPLFVAMLDAVILAGLLSAFSRRATTALLTAGAGLVAAVCTAWALAPPPAPLYPLACGIWVHRNAAVVHLDPELWLDRQCPVGLVGPGGNGPTATWCVLVRPDCARCKNWAADFKRLAKRTGASFREFVIGSHTMKIGSGRYEICAWQDPVAFLVDRRGTVRRVEPFAQKKARQRGAPPRCPMRYGAS